jgi:hypothetical protein
MELVLVMYNFKIIIILYIIIIMSLNDIINPPGNETWKSFYVNDFNVANDLNVYGNADVSGNLNVSGTINGNTAPSTSIVPTIDNAFNLGSSSNRFMNLYLGTDADISGNVNVVGNVTCNQLNYTTLNPPAGTPIVAANSIVYSDGTNLLGDPAQLSWNDASGSMIVAQREVTTLSTVLKISSDAGGDHGFGAHLEIAGNPGGGGTIFRTDGGLNNSALQIYGGDYTGTQGGSLYLNGNNSTQGDAGGAQFVLGLQNSGCSFQVLDASFNTLISVNPSGSVGQVMIPSLAPSSLVLTDSGQNLITVSTTSATATAGSATLPLTPAAFLPIMVGGTSYKIPLYNV